jgi:hypothetical protein
MTRPRAADDFEAIRERMHELRRESRPRAADDFATIRARIEELHRERHSARSELQHGEARGSPRITTIALPI